ncbi:TPA: hypothetical protein ACVFHF_003331 [Pseudomonas aeruginosa]
MDIDTFKVEDFFPHYLTQEQKTGLADAFRQFSPDSNIYTDLFATEILQGDCWENLPYFDYNSSQTRKVKGVILSNSCDIDQDNKRDLPVNVTFAPLVSFDKYKAALENSQDLSRESIDQKLNAIKEQRVTSLIFFPAGASLLEDCIAVLDSVFSLPLKLFLQEKPEHKNFTLNQLGHFLFAFKLSIHYCRLHEGLHREV